MLSMHAIRQRIILVPAGKTRPFDQHVFLPIIGAALPNDRLNEGGIVHFGCRLNLSRMRFLSVTLAGLGSFPTFRGGSSRVKMLNYPAAGRVSL